jgi:hypothetical protein
LISLIFNALVGTAFIRGVLTLDALAETSSPGSELSLTSESSDSSTTTLLTFLSFLTKLF